MMISRLAIKSMIIREVKKALNDPSIITESDIASKLMSGSSVDDIVDKIKKIKNIDNIILLALKTEKGKKEFSEAVSNIEKDKDKKQIFLDVMGKLRGVLAPSTYEKLKLASGLKF